MATTAWRYLLSAIALFALFIAVGDAFDARRLGDIGITYDSLSENRAAVRDVLPGSQAARYGVRPGDRIRAPWLRSDAVFRSPNPFRTRAGQSVTFYDERLRRNVVVLATPLGTTFSPSRVFAHGMRIFVVLLALLLFWNFAGDRAARALGLFLVAYETQGFGDTGSFAFGSLSGAVTNELSGDFMFLPLVLFACWFPNRHPTDARRWIALAATVLTAAIVALAVLALRYAAFGSGPHLDNATFIPVRNYVQPGATAALLIAAIVFDFRTASPMDRLRLEWISFGAALIAYAFLSLTISPSLFQSYAESFSVPGLVLNDVSDVAGIACILYAFFKYRVLDLTFAISRATVYALLSTLIVAAFILVEYLVGKYVETQSHLTGAIITLVFALALGFGLRTLHRNVDRFADRLIFRARYESEEALRSFGRRASFFTNERGLQETAVAALAHYARSQSAAIYLAGTDGDFELSTWCLCDPAKRISCEDPAVLALKDERRPLFVPKTSCVEGELAFPMLVRGELMGFVSCGKRRVREGYAADEIDAMNYALEHVAVQLDAIRTARLQTQLREVRELVSAYKRLGADPYRILAQIADVSGAGDSGYEENTLWKTPTRPDGPNAPKISSTT